MAGALCTGTYPSCLLLYFNISCGMLTSLLNVNMKTFEVEGDQRKHQGTVDKSFSKNRSVLHMTISFVVLKTGPIHQALVGITAGRQAVRQKHKCSNFLFLRGQHWKDLKYSIVSVGFIELQWVFVF